MVPVASDPSVMESVASLPWAMGLDSATQLTWPLGSASLLITDQPIDQPSVDQIVEFPDPLSKTFLSIST